MARTLRGPLAGLALAVLALGVVGAGGGALVARAGEAELNARVLEVARSFADGGGYDRSWKGSGCPVEVRHGDVRILGAAERGSYCCGFTFAVVMQVAREAGLLEGKSAAEVKLFQRRWYGAVEEAAERQCAQALEQLGIGRPVAAGEARPGDFVQFWRHSGSGHSVVFLGWVVEGGERVGIRYRSSQGSTDGIGDHQERFGGERGIDRARVHVGRLGRG